MSPTARPPRLARFNGRGAHRSFSHAVYLNFEFIFRIPIGELLSNGLYAIEDDTSGACSFGPRESPDLFTFLLPRIPRVWG